MKKDWLLPVLFAFLVLLIHAIFHTIHVVYKDAQLANQLQNRLKL